MRWVTVCFVMGRRYAIIGLAGWIACSGARRIEPPAEPQEPTVLAPTTADPALEPMAAALRALIEQVAATSEEDPPSVRGQILLAAPAVTRFYMGRGYEPAWTSLPAIEALLAAFAVAEEHGMRPARYHGTAINELIDLDGQLDPARSAELEVLLSDGFLALAGHLLAGRLDPTTLEADWSTVRRQGDVVAALEEALRSGSIRAALEQQAPPQAGYAELRAALVRYRELADAGGWPSLETPGPRPGARGASVERLTARLAIEGYLDEPRARYDARVRAAVRSYQSRHGLSATGILDAETTEELNVAVDRRLRVIELNLERWRWLSQQLGDPHILVNIPAFELDLVSNGAIAQHSRIIVGKDYRKTPVFSAPITSIVINPHWTIPRTILIEDKVPLIRADPGYLARNHITVLGKGDVEVDPTTVDWTEAGSDRFPYRLRMAPGPDNPLGRLKFELPNPFAVYLHDTSDPSLFGKRVRTYSSGCIRVENPLDLAVAVLGGSKDRKDLRALIADGEQTIVEVASPMPVHLVYWTAWIDAGGALQLRPDIYGRDARLDAALLAHH